MDEYKFPFEMLAVWKKSRELHLTTHNLLNQFPPEEKFILLPQIRRAATSVCCNLSEGSTRISFKDQAHFTSLAYGSLIELLNLYILSFDLGRINEATLLEIKMKIRTLSGMLNNYRKSQLERYYQQKKKSKTDPKPLNQAKPC